MPRAGERGKTPAFENQGLPRPRQYGEECPAVATSKPGRHRMFPHKARPPVLARTGGLTRFGCQPDEGSDGSSCSGRWLTPPFSVAPCILVLVHERQWSDDALRSRGNPGGSQGAISEELGRLEGVGEAGGDRVTALAYLGAAVAEMRVASHSGAGCASTSRHGG
jgi:hypothetical protein